MKVKNLKLIDSKLVFRDKTIKFDSEGISEDLKDKEAKSLASLPNFEIVKEGKDSDKILDKEDEKITNNTEDKSKDKTEDVDKVDSKKDSGKKTK